MTALARRLIVNADDFGRSPSINAAVIRAHQEGILTTASLMVNEPAFEEAVRLARSNPRLGVGLHLTLLCGHSSLPRDVIPGLVNASGEFTNNPAVAGFSYFFNRNLRKQLRREVQAQFQKFRSTGLLLDHVNGHLHMHLHPTIFRILMNGDARHPTLGTRNTQYATHNTEHETPTTDHGLLTTDHGPGVLGIRGLRLTYDPLRLNLRVATGHWAYRLFHALIFHPLAARARPILDRRGIRHTSAVFGLLQNARVDESYVLGLLPELPPGDSELYSHPCLEHFKNEFEALISPRVRALVRELRIELIRYQDL